MTERQRVTVRVPATTANLGPGFDAFGAALSLHLEATAVPAGAGPRVVTEGEGGDELATDDTNLVWQAFVALCERARVRCPELSVQVVNQVPLERGLGSSAAAIVAGLGLARSWCALTVGDRDLLALAAELEGHPDNVAPALLGGLTCVARDGDGRLEVRRTRPHPRLRPVVLVPAQRQSTSVARTTLPTSLPREAVVDQVARAGLVLGGLAGLWPSSADLAGDRLHEPARLEAAPGTAAVVATLRAAGAHAWLSGAGPAVCATVPVNEPGWINRCAEAGAAHGFEARALRWDLAGLLVEGR